MKQIWILLLGIILLGACSEDGKPVVPEVSGISSAESFTDPRDGQVYKCVNINGQVWMAENLRFRLERGSGDGCYTYDEKWVDTLKITVANEDFWAVCSRAIADGTISEFYDQMMLEMLIDPRANNTPAQIIEGMEYFPATVAILEQLLTDLKKETELVTRSNNFKDAEKNNGNYSQTYGLLYSYDAAQKAVPLGWRLPSDADWKKLEKFLGMAEGEVNLFDSWRGEGLGLLLQKGEYSIGFDAVMGGCNGYTPATGTNYIKWGESSYFWTSELIQETDSTWNGVIRSVSLTNDGILRTTTRLQGKNVPVAYSIRCIKKEDE